MLWPTLTILAVLAALTLNWWWRRRFIDAEAAAARRLEQARQAEAVKDQRLRTREEALFNSMVEGVLLLDNTGRVLLANRACNILFGVAGNPVGRSLMEIVRSHELDALVDGLSQEQSALSRELDLGEDRFLLVNATAVFHSPGERHGTLLVFHDLTRLKQLERTREEFVANVSHELRTPLSLIKGYSETLLDGAKDDPEVLARFLGTIDRNAARLKFLIEDLLTISELESGRLRMTLQPLRLGQVLDKVLADLKPRAAARDIRLEGPPEDLALHADPDRLEQVLGNLIDNAIKYGRPGGQVAIRTRVMDSVWVEVSVHDDGPGIPPEAIDRVFERFYRVDKARSRDQGGTGLGLSIVKHIVQSHGGRVWALSPPGQGASLYFTMPRAPEAD